MPERLFGVIEDYNSHVNKPTLVYHADWGSTPSKRWCAKAALGTDGRYTASEPVRVGDLTKLLVNLRAEAGALGTIFAGFDFPIGLPAHFAERAGITKFKDFLPLLGTGEWKDFHSVCDNADDISLYRPFYPYGGQKGSLLEHLLRGHGVTTLEPLLRLCERAGHGHQEASCLFWTMGPKQVGKAALIGWRYVLAQAIKENSVRIRPFDGNIEFLLQPGHTVIAETYPAECYSWFSGHPLRSKTDIESRKSFGSNLLDWARGSVVTVEPQLENTIKAGFPIGTDDAFDAVVGLFGMLQICLGERDVYEPEDETIREIEGWILSRRSRYVEQAPMKYSATTDPGLTDWLRWASDSGEASSFVHAIAEAAFLADLPNYSLLRPVLLELKQEYPEANTGRLAVFNRRRN